MLRGGGLPRGVPACANRAWPAHAGSSVPTALPMRRREVPMSRVPQQDVPSVVVPLGDLDAGSVPVAGGKGANLGELIRAGFPVPDGFCLTTGAYRAVATAAGLAGVLTRLAALAPDDVDGAAELASQARERILATPV